MILTRRLSPILILRIGLRVAMVAGPWAIFVYALYAFAELKFLRVPFLPISTIGTAVAFYVGFKNNASYERFWEGRKIWGAVVNASRTWATSVVSYIDVGDEGPAAHATRRALIYRHLAWMNALRLQLRKTSRFFNRPSRTTKRRLEQHTEHMRNDWDQELRPFLDDQERETVSAQVNPATHMVTRQGTDLAGLVKAGQVDLFHQIAMMDVLRELYDLQGKCERIKNTPFPRQYAEMSRIFVKVFTFLVPLGLLDVFAEHIERSSQLQTISYAIPMVIASILVSWVFTTMEGVGDSSEDPFERSMNDVPMNALCRTVEIDLRQMLGETELPAKEQAIDHVLY